MEIYWKIRQPGKSWSTWSDGTAESVDEAQRDAIMSLIDDETNQLYPWAHNVRVEMWRLVSIDDYRVTEAHAQAFRTNYLGIQEDEHG